MGIKVVATNRKAHFEFFLLETFEAGLALHGTEIKSIRAGQISITESFIKIENGEAWLVNAHIAPYDPGSYNNHDPKRERRLLLHQRELRQMWEAVRQKGMTIVPVKVYLKDGRAKLEISIARGKKLYDKRAEIAKKDLARDLDRQRSRHD